MDHLPVTTPTLTPLTKENLTMRTILLSAAASLMLLGSAAAAEGSAFGQPGLRARVAVDIPALDTGSEAYPSPSQAIGVPGDEGRDLGGNPAREGSSGAGSAQPLPDLR